MKSLIAETEGYSCADLNQVVKEAAMIPVRELPTEELMKLTDTSQIRPISLADFRQSLKTNSPSVSHATMKEFDDWRKSKG